MEKTPNSALNRLSVEEFREASKHSIHLVLDNIRSLNNIGSVFRSADAYLINGIVLCGITARPPHRDINKTALGATESVAWTYNESAVDAVRELQATGWKVYALEQAEKAVPLHQFNPEAGEKCALVLGNEVSGVQQEVMDIVDGAIEISQFGSKHSLNIAVAAGIAIYEVWRKLSNA